VKQVGGIGKMTVVTIVSNQDTGYLECCPSPRVRDGSFLPFARPAFRVRLGCSPSPVLVKSFPHQR
jgi:hypothetical protein